MYDFNLLEKVWLNGEAYKRGSPRPSGYNPRSDKAWLNTTGCGAKFLRIFRGVRCVSRLNCGQAHHKGTEEETDACSDIELSRLKEEHLYYGRTNDWSSPMLSISYRTQKNDQDVPTPYPAP
jgi:hypothetical protein